MKNFLKNLQGIQDECLGKLKNGRETSLPEKIAGATICNGSRKVQEPNEIAGGDGEVLFTEATVHSMDGTVSWEEWEQIRENIDKHSKTWRRFKTDPNKVVIEKNFLFNFIHMTKGFFIFRPIDNDGNTYLKVNPRFIFSIPEEKYFGELILLMATATSGLLGIFANLYFLFGLLFLPLSFWVHSKNEKVRVKDKKDWENKCSQNPSVLLQIAPASLLFGEKSNKYVSSGVIKIDFTNSPFQLEYEKMISKLAVSAQQIKGRLVWLWRYDSLLDSFNFSYEEFRQLPNEIILEIKMYSSNIMPAIETENSFIFFLDEFTEEMDKIQKENDLYLEMARSRIKNPENTYFKDDMFRNCFDLY